jgi:hypothetical protein
MTISYAPVLSKSQLNNLFDFANLDQPVKLDCQQQFGSPILAEA